MNGFILTCEIQTRENKFEIDDHGELLDTFTLNYKNNSYLQPLFKKLFDYLQCCTIFHFLTVNFIAEMKKILGLQILQKERKLFANIQPVY